MRRSNPVALGLLFTWTRGTEIFDKDDVKCLSSTSDICLTVNSMHAVKSFPSPDLHILILHFNVTTYSPKPSIQVQHAFMEIVALQTPDLSVENKTVMLAVTIKYQPSN